MGGLDGAEGRRRVGAAHRGPDATRLAAYLARPGVRFDGHKGRPLDFGASDHQLHQPLNLVRGDGAAAQVEEIAPPVAVAEGGCRASGGAA